MNSVNIANTSTTYLSAAVPVPMRAAVTLTCASGDTTLLCTTVSTTMGGWGTFDNPDVGQNNFYGCNSSVTAATGSPFTVGRSANVRTVSGQTAGLSLDAEL